MNMYSTLPGLPREFSLVDGLAHLDGFIREKILANQKTTILVGAGTGAGKGYLIDSLVKRYPDHIGHLAADYSHRGDAFRVAHGYNFDQPELYDLQMVRGHILDFQAGRSITR